MNLKLSCGDLECYERSRQIAMKALSSAGGIEYRSTGFHVSMLETTQIHCHEL
jgi:hypothetical protein